MYISHSGNEASNDSYICKKNLMPLQCDDGSVFALLQYPRSWALHHFCSSVCIQYNSVYYTETQTENKNRGAWERGYYCSIFCWKSCTSAHVELHVSCNCFSCTGAHVELHVSCNCFSCRLRELLGRGTHSLRL